MCEELSVEPKPKKNQPSTRGPVFLVAGRAAPSGFEEGREGGKEENMRNKRPDDAVDLSNIIPPTPAGTLQILLEFACELPIINEKKKRILARLPKITIFLKGVPYFSKLVLSSRYSRTLLTPC